MERVQRQWPAERQTLFSPEPDNPQRVPTTDGKVVVENGALHVGSRTGLQPLLIKTLGPVTLADREGVFAHSFKCWVCDLEFVLFSWRRNRHGVGRVTCPECGVATPMLHWVTLLSLSLTFNSDADAMEIFNMVPIGTADLLDDSSPPPAERFEAPNS